MDFHDFLKIAGGIGALALFVPMAVGIIKDGGAGQSFATWMLWAALDTVLTISLFQQRGNYFFAARLCHRRCNPDRAAAGPRAFRLEPHGQCDFGARARLSDWLETGRRKDGHRCRHDGNLSGRDTGLGRVVAEPATQSGKHLGMVCAGQRAGLSGRNRHDPGRTLRPRSVCGLFPTDVFCEPETVRCPIAAQPAGNRCGLSLNERKRGTALGLWCN